MFFINTISANFWDGERPKSAKETSVCESEEDNFPLRGEKVLKMQT